MDDGLAFSDMVPQDKDHDSRNDYQDYLCDGEEEEGDIDAELAFSEMVPQDKDNDNDNQDYLCDGEEEEGDIDAGPL